MISQPEHSKIIEEFRQRRPRYESFANKLEDLIEYVLKKAGINVHSVTCRAKEVASFEKKVGRDGSAYASLNEITDLAGVRVITYFHDDVERAAELIQKEFDIDPQNSVDKRKLHEPDRFGYMSLHYVLSMSDARCALIEYQEFKGLKAEVQVRSLLQHTWAEIEHDLGYKSATGVPKHVRRRFARLSGLLELADEEFAGIRDRLFQYTQEVPAQITEAPQEVSLDAISLAAFIDRSEIVKRIEQNFEGRGEPRIARLLELAKSISIQTVGALETEMGAHEKGIHTLMAGYQASLENFYPTRGDSVTLIVLLAVTNYDNDEIRSWVKRVKGAATNTNPKVMVDWLLNATKAAGIPMKASASVLDYLDDSTLSVEP